MVSRRPEGVPEDRVTKILTRAAELDRGPATLSLDTIRAAAMEAGISRAAVDQALEEYAAGLAEPAVPVAAAQTPRAPGRIRRWLRKLATPLQLSALAFALGLGLSVGEAMIPAAIFLWIAVALRLLLRLRRAGNTGMWQLTMTLMTFFICFSYGAVEGDEDVLAALLFTGVALFATGTAVIHWSSPEDSPSDEHAAVT